MKRDMELVRQILLAVESGQAKSAFDGYDDDSIKYHKALVIEAGLAEGSVLKSGTGNREIPANVVLKKLTWAGHDFIDAISSESNWKKVKFFLQDGGKQLTIETVKAAVVHLFGFDT
ncbi:hypothetical protein XarjCFBP7653_21095 [Xanthomonas arboricola]|nr:hypothetical protein XarjCFBP7653_21095 [Xanthomonas arboricola]